MRLESFSSFFFQAIIAIEVLPRILQDCYQTEKKPISTLLHIDVVRNYTDAQYSNLKTMLAIHRTINAIIRDRARLRKRTARVTNTKNTLFPFCLAR